MRHRGFALSRCRRAGLCLRTNPPSDLSRQSQSHVLLFSWFTLSWVQVPSPPTIDPMEAAGPAKLAICFQAGFAASAAVPGPAPYLNRGPWQAHRCRVLKSQSPALFGVTATCSPAWSFSSHCNSFQPRPLTPPTCLFCRLPSGSVCLGDLLSPFFAHLHFSFLSGSS